MGDSETSGAKIRPLTQAEVELLAWEFGANPIAVLKAAARRHVGGAASTGEGRQSNFPSSIVISMPENLQLGSALIITSRNLF
jgi:hypothetical protein